MATSLEEIMKNLGPLAQLAGTWEGGKGDDVALDDDLGVEKNRYRERMTFVPFGPVDNHAQKLWGLRYTTTAWRVDAVDAFHEEVGYWLWDPKEKQVMRCFMIPRGVTVLAGGTVEPDAKGFKLSAEVGSQTYGICSNLFLDREFRTVRFDMNIRVENGDTLYYDEDTQLKLKESPTIFHHTDKNVLKRC